MTMGIWYEGMLRWVGAATRVMARGQVVVKQRNDPETGEPHHVTVPDHVEIIADMAFGGVAHLRLGSVLGLNRGPEIWIHGTEGTLHSGPGHPYPVWWPSWRQGIGADRNSAGATGCLAGRRGIRQRRAWQGTRASHLF